MSTSRQRAQAHARQPHYCSCGYIIHGNGAKWAHASKHERASDGHGWWTTTQWEQHGRPCLNHPDPERRRPIIKPRHKFVCRACGHTHLAWAARCPDCFSLEGLVPTAERP